MGDYVDIVANSSIHKGMPHKWVSERTRTRAPCSRRAPASAASQVWRWRTAARACHARAPATIASASAGRRRRAGGRRCSSGPRIVCNSALTSLLPATLPLPPPARYYHGRTGIVYNVAKRAVGVEVNKVIRNRVEKKRVNIRIEHIRPSKCRTDFLARVQRVDKIKRDAKAKGEKVPIGLIKRFPVAPKAGHVVKASDSKSLPIMQAPVRFDDML